MHLSETQLAAYQRDGVLPLGQVMDQSAVEEARRRLAALREKNLMDSPSDDPDKTSFRLLNASDHEPWLKTIFADARVLDPAESVLGENIQYFQDNIFHKSAVNGCRTAWHQDNIWWHADPPKILTIWIALDDVTAQSGGVRYIPGSHTHLLDPELPVEDPSGSKYSVLADDQVDASKAITFDVPAGHAVMHHCLTIHGAPPNTSDRPRRGYTVHLMQAGLTGADASQRPVLRGSLTTA